MKRFVELVDEVVEDWRGAKPEVMLLDDEAVARVLVRRVIEEMGCAMFEAENGQAAIDLYEDRLASGKYIESGVTHFPFDFVILDLKMPPPDGLAVLRHIKKRVPKQPVAIFTAFATEYDLNEAAKLGYVGVVRKPLTSEGLAQALEAHQLRVATKLQVNLA